MTPIGLQLWTMRDEAAKDFAGTLARVAEMGYAGVETAGLHGWPAARFTSCIRELGLELVGCFSALPEPAGIEQALSEPLQIGSRSVIAGIDRADCRSIDTIKQGIERINRFAERAHDEGVALSYHNHWWEFAEVDGRLPYAVLLDEMDPRVFLEVDIYWMAVGGVDPAAELRRLGPRVKRLHVKDGPLPASHAHLAVGAGALDIPAILRAAPDVDWHLVEMDAYDGDVFEAVEASHRYMASIEGC